jgi:hypothetical protein
VIQGSQVSGVSRANEHASAADSPAFDARQLRGEMQSLMNSFRKKDRPHRTGPEKEEVSDGGKDDRSPSSTDTPLINAVAQVSLRKELLVLINSYRKTSDASMPAQADGSEESALADSCVARGLDFEHLLDVSMHNSVNPSKSVLVPPLTVKKPGACGSDALWGLLDVFADRAGRPIGISVTPEAPRQSVEPALSSEKTAGEDFPANVAVACALVKELEASKLQLQDAKEKMDGKGSKDQALLSASPSEGAVDSHTDNMAKTPESAAKYACDWACGFTVRYGEVSSHELTCQACPSAGAPNSKHTSVEGGPDYSEATVQVRDSEANTPKSDDSFDAASLENLTSLGALDEPLVTGLESDCYSCTFDRTSSKLQSYLHRLIEDKTARHKSALRRHLLTAAFQGWLCSDARLVRRQRIWNVIWSRWSNGSLFAVFRQWSAVVGVAKKGRRVLKKASLCWHRSSLSRGFLGWYSATIQMKRTKNIAAKVLGRISNRALAIAFYSLWHHARDTCASRQSVSDIILNLKKESLTQAFENWMHSCKQTRDGLQRRQAISLNAWMQLPEHQAFQSWQEHAEVQKKMRGTACRAMIARLMSQCLPLALEGWMENVQRLRGLRATLCRVLIRMQKKSISAAWISWGHFSKRSHSHRNKKVKVMMRAMKLLVSKAFDSWGSKVKRLCRQRRLLHRFVNQWQLHTVSRALATWVDKMRIIKKFKLKTRMVVKRWMNQTLSNALATWVLKIRQEKILRSKVRASIARWTNQGLWQTYSAWTDHVRQERRRNVKGLECLRRWRNTALSTNFVFWALRMQQKIEIRDMILRNAFKCNTDCILKAFSTWSSAVQLARKSQLNLLSSSLSAHPTALSVSMDLEFDSTFSTSNERSSFEKQLQVDICDALDIAVERVFVLCHQKGSIVSEIVLGNPRGLTKHDSEELALALADQVGKPGSALFRTPLGKHMTKATVHGPICEQAVAALRRTKVEDGKQARLRGIIFRMRHDTLSSTLDFWIHSFREQKRLWYAARRVIKRRERANAARSWKCWVDGVYQLACQRGNGYKAFRRWANYTASRIFSSWKQVTSKSLRVQRVKDKAIMRMRSSALFRVLFGWMQARRERVRLRNGLSKFLLMSSKREMSDTIDTWRARVAEFVRQQNVGILLTWVQRLERMTLRMRNPVILRWRDLAAGKKQMKAKALKVVERLMKSALKGSFERWRDAVVEQAQELAKQQLEAAAREKQSMAETEAERRIEMCKRVVQRMLRHQLLIAWSMFVDTVRETQHNRETLRKVLGRMQHRQLAGAFDCYAGAVELLVAQRETLARMMAVWRTPGLKKAWEAWTAYLEIMDGERAQETQELAKQQLEAAAREKQSMAETEAERRIEMCKRVVQRMLRHQLLIAWSMFVDTVRETQHNRETLRKVLGRMQHRQLAGAFDCYAGAVELLVAQRETLARMMAVWRTPGLKKAWEAWTAYLEIMDGERAQETQELAKQELEAAAREKQSMAETEAERRIEMCKRVVQRMLRHQLLIAWSMFVDTVRETQHNRETLRKVLGRMQHRQLAGAFDCYAGAVELLVAQRETLARMMAVWRTPGLKKAWEAWTAYLEIMDGERAQETQELAKQELEAAAREKQSMAETEAERRIEMCKRVVQRMLRHQLLIAWSMFVDTVRETQHNRETLRKVLGRMQHRQLAGAFDCYAGAVELLVAQRETLARMMAVWRTPGLKKAWEAWTAYLEIMDGERAQETQELAKQQLEAAAREKQSMAETEAERRIEMCKRVVQRMLRHQLLIAWSMFVDTVRETQHNRETLRKVLVRMQNRQLAGAFDCYAGAVELLVAQRETLARMMAVWRTPGLKKAWEAWTAYLEIMDGERAQEAQELAKQQLEAAAREKQSMAETEAERRIEMCKRVVQRMLRHQLLIAWSMFVDTVRETQHNRETLRKVLGRMQHRQLAGAFDCYAGAVELLVAQRETLARMMAVWRTPGLKKAWEAWTAYLEIMDGERAQEAQELAKQQLEAAAREKQIRAQEAQDRQMKAKALKMLQRLMRRALMERFEGWRDTWQLQRRFRSKALKALHHIVRRAMSKTMSSWQKVTASNKRLRIRLSRILARLWKRTMSRVFEAWYSRAQTDRQMETKALKMLQRLMRRALVEGFERWHEQAVQEKHMKAKALKVVQRLMNIALVQVHRLMTWALVQGFSHWRFQAQGVARLKARAQNKCVVAALVAWIGHVKEVKRLRNVAQKVLLHWIWQALAMVFTMWHERVRERKRSRHIARKVQVRFKNKCVVAALAAWVEHVKEVKRLRHERVLDSQGRTDNKRRAMRRWSERKITKTFAAWATTTQNARALRSCSKKVILRMLQAGLCAAFLRWYEAQASVSRHKRLLRKAASRFSKPRLSKALHHWYDNVQEGMIDLQQEKHLDLVDRVLSTLSSRRWRSQLDSAWCIWARYTYRKRKFGCADLLIRSKRARNALCHAWGSIFLLCSVERDRRRAVGISTLMSQKKLLVSHLKLFTKSFQQWTTLSARFRTLAYAAACISCKANHRLLSRSFTEVRDVASHNKAARRGILTGWRRAAVKSMRSALQAWMDFRLYHARLRHAARMLITRARKVVVHEKFQLWLDSSRCKTEARALVAQDALIHQQATRICMRMVHRHGGKAFSLWAQLCERNNQGKAAAENLYAHFIYRLKSKAFGYFQAYLHTESNLRARLGRVINSLDRLSFAPRSLCGVRVRLIMRSWRTFIVDKKYDRQMRDEIIAEWHRNIKVRVFIAMFDHVAHSKQAKMQGRHVEGSAHLENEEGC